MNETEALQKATPGKGKFIPGEVYEQDLGRLGVRQVLIQGKDAQGNILGWYLPDKKSAELLGQSSGFLQEAKFTGKDRFPLRPSTSSEANIKSAINFMFPEKPISGQLVSGGEIGGVKKPMTEFQLKNLLDASKLTER